MSRLSFEENFFGRRPIFDVLKKRLLGLKEGYRQNIALLGDRYVGKSSILQKFLADLDDKDIIPIYLDLNFKDLSYVVIKYVGGLLHHYSKSQNFTLHEDVQLLIESTKKFIPQTAKAIAKIQADMAHGRSLEAYRALINLSEVFTAETNKFCVVILDEFQSLEQLALPHVFQELGKNIMTQKRCLYIVTSSSLEQAKKILSEKLSLLFGNFETIVVEPFDLKTSQDFIQQRLEKIKMGNSLQNFLIDFTGGHPLYLNLILQELRYLCAIHNQNEIYVPLLASAVENAIFNPWGVLSRHFELTVDQLCSVKGSGGAIPPILIALTSGRQKLQDVSRALGLKQSFVSQRLARLVEEGVVVKNGTFFYIKDKLFKYWLKYVLQKQLKAVDVSLEKQREAFLLELHRAVDDFKLASQKDLSLRITELLRRFENEALNMNGRRYRLPTFKKILPAKLKMPQPCFFDVLDASTEEGSWFIILKKDSLCEGDVSAVLTESKKKGTKTLGHIIISLADIEENAKLKALQERMWVWNEHELNTLLNFYDQPYILLGEDPEPIVVEPPPADPQNIEQITQ